MSGLRGLVRWSGKQAFRSWPRPPYPVLTVPVLPSPSASIRFTADLRRSDRRRRLGTAVIAALVLLPAAGEAQSKYEVEVGGGFHTYVPIADLIRLPPGPTVNAAAVRWWNDRWGLAGHFTTTIAGSTSAHNFTPAGVRDRMIYVHLMVRYRRRLASGRELHLATGGFTGFMSWRERGLDRGEEIEDVLYQPVFTSVELMMAQPLTDAIDVRYGLQVLPLVFPTLALHPMVTFAWKFGQR